MLAILLTYYIPLKTTICVAFHHVTPCLCFFTSDHPLPSPIPTDPAVSAACQRNNNCLPALSDSASSFLLICSRLQNVIIAVIVSIIILMMGGSANLTNSSSLLSSTVSRILFRGVSS